MPTRTPTPGPDHRDLYLIIIGIIVGVLIGPGVLGRFAPDAYQKAFVGGTETAARLEDLQKKMKAKLELLAASGATGVAGVEFADREQKEMAVLGAQLDQERQQHGYWLVGRAAGIILAIIAVMIVETLIDPRNLWLRSRLATARYGLIALWIALLLAQPALLKNMPLEFTALLVAVALIAGLVPLGGRTKAEG